MVGRAAHGAPWIFRDINGLLTTGVVPAPLTRAAQRDIVLAHLQAIYAFHGEDSGLRIARKHLGWYGKLLDDTPAARARFMAAPDTASQFACAVREFGAWCGETADAA
jgi:tRNA-dihydrouridine synthase B